MVDMNARMYRCCGADVEVSGYTVEREDGKRGHRVYCSLCKSSFVVPGQLDEAKLAIPDHFRSVHDMQGKVEDY